MKSPFSNTKTKATLKNQKGSLSLEHVLFIGAIAGLSMGILAFYSDVGAYLNGISLADSPTNLGSTN